METCITAHQEHCSEHQLFISKDTAAAATPKPSTAPSSPSPPRDHNSAHHSNKDATIPEDLTKKSLNVGDDDQPSLSLNLTSSCSQREDDRDCSPGSPEFFLPANAYISLDDPSFNLLSSYTSPSDPNSMIWPCPLSPSSALLNCPSIFSAGTSSADEGSISCEQIPSHFNDMGTSQILYNPCNSGFPEGALSYSALLQSHHQYPPSLQLPTNNMMQPSSFNGFSQMMQGSSNYHYGSGSCPFGAFQGSHYPNAAAYNRMLPNVFAANTRAGMLEQCLNEAQHEQEEQSWYTFLQPTQEDHDAGCQLQKLDAINTNLRGSTSMVTMPADSQHHHHRKHSNYMQAHLCSPQPDMPMANVHHLINMEVTNGMKGHSTMQSMQLKTYQDKAHIEEAVSSCTSLTNKRPTPDGEESWAPAEAHALSPPLKMKRSPSFSSTRSRVQAQADHPMHHANHTHNINSFTYGAEKLIAGNVMAASNSCTSVTLSPSKQSSNPIKPGLSLTGSPTSSNNQLDHPQQRRPTKSLARQSVCNDPQSVAARVDLVTMLEKAISYVKSLQLQVKVLSTDEYWPTPLSDKYSLTNLAAVAKLAASTYN
ncbi:hypothetical protein L7F22_004441 [Adiantum nelumboides]|nr:hypothetical protein [Adiantum nelumboides]